MQPHHFIHLMDADAPSATASVQQREEIEQQRSPDASHLSQEEIEQAIIREWIRLQQTPSYVERLIQANHDFIEGIASQS